MSRYGWPRDWFYGTLAFLCLMLAVYCLTLIGWSLACGN